MCYKTVIRSQEEMTHLVETEHTAQREMESSASCAPVYIRVRCVTAGRPARLFNENYVEQHGRMTYDCKLMSERKCFKKNSLHAFASGNV